MSPDRSADVFGDRSAARWGLFHVASPATGKPDLRRLWVQSRTLQLCNPNVDCATGASFTAG